MTSDSLAPFPFHYRPSEHETEIVDFFSSDPEVDADAAIRSFEQAETVVALDHEQRLQRMIAEDEYLSGRNGETAETRNFIICFSNRCGSNLLASLMSTNPQVPRAGEFFLREVVIRESRERGLSSLGQYVEYLKRDRASKGGIFGTKLSWEQLYFLTRAGAIPRLIEAPTFIHIYRRNVLDQAISFSIALQNLKWTSRDKAVRADEEIEFNEAQIINIMNANYISRARFQAYFELFGARVISVAYEDLQDDLKGVGERVIRQLRLGLKDIRVRPERVRLQPQRSSLNERFRQALTDKYGSLLEQGATLDRA